MTRGTSRPRTPGECGGRQPPGEAPGRQVVGTQRPCENEWLCRAAAQVAPGSRERCRGSGLLQARGSLQAGAFSHSGCCGPPVTRGGWRDTLLSQSHRWPELTAALQASVRLPRPRPTGPASPWPGSRPRAAMLHPPPQSCFCWVPVFTPSHVLGRGLPEDRRCDLVKTFSSLSFFSFCSTHPEAGWAGCSESKGLSLS